MGTPMRDPLARSESRDGCQCPPWVLRCVHFEGQVLRLHDLNVGMSLHDPHCSRRNFPLSYAVALGGELRPATCGCKLDTCHDPTFRRMFRDLPAAEAEFERREALLVEPSSERSRA